MRLNRVDLADIHAPARLARALHDQLAHTSGRVPVVEIARALDIAEVRVDTFDGFEGMLLTDKVRSKGVILASRRHGRLRARFTVAHELGHFLLERHLLSAERGFTCQARDLRETRDGRQHQRQETEANRFAIELLAPPSLFDPHLSDLPDLRDAQRLRDQLDISLEACVRRMVERRDEPLAAVWSVHGWVRYLVRDAGFPFIPFNPGDRLPQLSHAFRVTNRATPGFTEFVEVHSHAWTNQPEQDLFEQTRLSPNGHAVTLLWADLPGHEEDSDDGSLRELGTPRFR